MEEGREEERQGKREGGREGGRGIGREEGLGTTKQKKGFSCLVIKRIISETGKVVTEMARGRHTERGCVLDGE